MFGKAKCRLCGDNVRFALRHLKQKHSNIYDKEITKRYVKHEIQRLSKKYPERETGAVGKPFKLDVKNRRLMLLVYYRLFHITYVYVSCLSLCFRSKEQPLQIYTKD